MKKCLPGLLLLSLFGSAQALETPLHIPYAPDIAKIIERGELRVAMYGNNFPPFIIKSKDGSVSGYNVEVAQAIATQLGVKLFIDSSAQTFDGAVALVALDKDDMAVSSLTATPDRALSVDFSVPYYQMPQALLMNKKSASKKWQLKADIISNAPLRIGVSAGSSYSSYAKLAFPHAQLMTYPNLPAGLEKLAANNYDVIFTDALSAEQATKSGLTMVVLGGEHVDPLTIAVNVNAPHLLGWLNTYLTSPEVRATGLKDGVLGLKAS